MGIGEGEGHCLHRALLDAGIDLYRRRCRRGRAELLHRPAEAAAGPHRHAFPVGRRHRRLAFAQQFVLRQIGRRIGHRVPAREFLLDGRMGVDRVAHFAVVIPARHWQEGQRQRHQRRVLLRVVEVAEHRPFERADLQPVQILARFGERRAIVDLEHPVAAGLRGEQGGQFLDACGEGALLAPDRIVPGQFRAVDLGGAQTDVAPNARAVAAPAMPSTMLRVQFVIYFPPCGLPADSAAAWVPHPSNALPAGFASRAQPSGFPAPAASAAPSW